MSNLLDIKSFLKFLSRNKGYTAIDVFGLSVSLMFVILIAVYVERELNIDKQQANYDRIVAIGNEEFLESAVPVSYWLEERYPEIEKVCPVITDQGKGKQIFYGFKQLIYVRNDPEEHQYQPRQAGEKRLVLPSAVL